MAIRTDSDSIRAMPAHLSVGSSFLLAAIIAFPSFGVTQKYAGTGWIVAQVAVSAMVLYTSGRIIGRIAPWIRRRFTLWAAAAVLALLGGYVLLHPYEDGKGPGLSSDRDEGLEMAVARISSGLNPYYPDNEVAGPLSVLPGSIVLAAPFVWIGDVGFQNVFWMAVFLIVVWRCSGDGAYALWLLSVPFILSPAAAYEWISGGDLIANGIFVAIAILLVLTAWSPGKHPPWWRWASCVALGVALASRANFPLLLPIVFASVWRMAGWRSAVTASVVVTVVMIGLTLPFYLVDPQGFTPWLSRGKISFASSTWWWAPHLVILLTLLSSVLWGAWIVRSRRSRAVHHCLLGCAITTFVPNMVMVAMLSLGSGHLDFGFTRDRFGLMYVFFALLAWPWIRSGDAAPHPVSAGAGDCTTNPARPR